MMEGKKSEPPKKIIKISTTNLTNEELQKVIKLKKLHSNEPLEVVNSG